MVGYNEYRQRRKNGIQGRTRGETVYIRVDLVRRFLFLVKSEKKDLTRTAKSGIIYKNGQVAPLCLFLGAAHKTLTL